MQTIIPEPEFTLKATPPRLPRMVVRRERLIRRWETIRGERLIVVTAPDGYGKTTLLLQWRRTWLEHGALVAWITADCRDRPVRFAAALAHALRQASGRSRADAQASRHAHKADAQTEGLTGLLAGIARERGEVVLMIDAAERLPEASVRQALAYLVHNAPSNLRVVLATTAPLAWPEQAGIDDAAACFGIDDLRLSPEEAADMLMRRARDRIDPGDGQRLHRATEGWPLGLQLAASAIEQATPSPRLVESVVWLRGPAERRYFDVLLAQLPADLLGFLSRIAILDHLHSDLCAAVTDDPAATAHLARALLDTPLWMVGQTKQWSCLHPLARKVLLDRFARLPVRECQQLHRRASAWYARQERYLDAARHADDAGDARQARSLRAHMLWQMCAAGRLAEAREALADMPDGDTARDPDLRLVASWICACSERHAQALIDARALLADPELDERGSYAASLVAAAAAGYADRPGLIPRLLARWPEGSPMVEGSGHAATHANCLAMHALHAGRTAYVREIEPRFSTSNYRYSPTLGRAFGRTMVALSHLWEGYPDRAEAVVRPALLQAEQGEGRRSPIAGMLAAVTAAATLERNQPDAALSLLAGRMDVMMATAIPDVILCARRTLARLAVLRHDEAQALLILDELRGVAREHDWPRLVLHALAEQIRIHALAGRVSALVPLEDELDALAPAFVGPDRDPFLPLYNLTTAIAKAQAAFARADIGMAERHLLTADALAVAMGRGCDLLVVRVLRALVAHQRGAPLALRLLGEALSLGKLGGNRRLLLDSYPQAVQMAAQLRSTTMTGNRALPRVVAMGGHVEPVPTLASTEGFLTSAEAGILAALDREASIEGVATALHQEPGLVQWHVGHLCAKLAVATPAALVPRARLFGLLGMSRAGAAAIPAAGR
ncbi:MAG: AAA family ATPase [Proteobacteria bacterium]|nr:AAA family ATPase [Pseudomonadota bacterium]